MSASAGRPNSTVRPATTTAIAVFLRCISRLPLKAFLCHLADALLFLLTRVDVRRTLARNQALIGFKSDVDHAWKQAPLREERISRRLGTIRELAPASL